MQKNWTKTLCTIDSIELSGNKTYFQWNDKISIQLLSSDLTVLSRNSNTLNTLITKKLARADDRGLQNIK